MTSRKEHVVIYRGLIGRTTIKNRNGVAVFDHDPPQPTYFVDYIDVDGVRCGDWSGPLHRMALEAAAEWGLPIIDQTGRGNLP